MSYSSIGLYYKNTKSNIKKKKTFKKNTKKKYKTIKFSKFLN